MATITSSTGTFDFASPSAWVGGVVPGPGDVAVLTGASIINITTNVACDRLESADSGMYGYYQTPGGVTITADIINMRSTGNYAISMSGTAPLTIVGSVTSGTGGNAYAVQNTGTGKLTVVGDVTSRGATSIYLSGASALEVTGNVSGPVAANGAVIYANVASNSIVVTGGVTGPVSGTAGAAIRLQTAGGQAKIFGTAQGNLSSGTSTIGSAVYLVAAGCFVEIVGGVSAGQACPAIEAQAATPYGNIKISGSLEWGPTGTSPVYGPRGFLFSPANPALSRVRLYDGAIPTSVPTDFYTTDNPAMGQPDPEDVRLGVEYGNGTFTGSAAIPPPESVAAGVPVDDTIGEAVITIPTLASVVGQLLADALDS